MQINECNQQCRNDYKACSTTVTEVTRDNVSSIQNSMHPFLVWWSCGLRWRRQNIMWINTDTKALCQAKMSWKQFLCKNCNFSCKKTDPDQSLRDNLLNACTVLTGMFSFFCSYTLKSEVKQGNCGKNNFSSVYLGLTDGKICKIHVNWSGEIRIWERFGKVHT